MRFSFIKTKQLLALTPALFLMFKYGIVRASELDYVPLAPLTDSQKGQSIDLVGYLPFMFNLLIGVSALLAIVMIVVGGVTYMTTDVFSQKSSGRETITHALQGLLLVISSYMILYTVNPDLLKFQLKFDTTGFKNSWDIGLPSAPGITTSPTQNLYQKVASGNTSAISTIDSKITQAEATLGNPDLPDTVKAELQKRIADAKKQEDFLQATDQAANDYATKLVTANQELKDSLSALETAKIQYKAGEITAAQFTEISTKANIAQTSQSQLLNSTGNVTRANSQARAAATAAATALDPVLSPTKCTTSWYNFWSSC
jgi:hypothetical protein